MLVWSQGTIRARLQHLHICNPQVTPLQIKSTIIVHVYLQILYTSTVYSEKKSSIQSNFYVNVTFLIHAELKTYAKFNLASTKHGRLSEIHDFTTCIHIKSNEINIRFYQSKTKKRKIKFPDYHFSNLVWENCSTLLNVELYVNVRIKSVLSSYWNSAELLCG